MATPQKGVRVTRKLRQWTVEQVESGKFPGLVWDDPPAKTMFRIPWKHAGKQEFRHEEDAGFFKAWAIFKGKYRPGEQLNPAAWKTRIRCALSKSPEFEEVPERSRLDSTEPYKVYRLVPMAEQIVGCQSKAKKAKLGRSKKNGGPPESITQPTGSLSVLKMEERSGPEATASHTPSTLDSSAFQTGENSPQPGEPAEVNKNVFPLNLEPVSSVGTDDMAIEVFKVPSPSLVNTEGGTKAETGASINGIGSLDITRVGPVQAWRLRQLVPWSWMEVSPSFKSTRSPMLQCRAWSWWKWQERTHPPTSWDSLLHSHWKRPRQDRQKKR